MPTVNIVCLQDAEEAFRKIARVLIEDLSNRPEKNPQSEYLSSTDVLHVLGISRATLARWRQLGSLPHYRIGEKILYLNSDVAQLVQKNKIISIYKQRITNG